MTIRLIEGLHLTATNRRHIGQILANGWQSGNSGKLAYSLAPIEGQAGRYRYLIRKRERDDWGRPVIRESRGIIEAALSDELAPLS